ncbi:MAG: 4-hydroxythreonine-4-phosphate dehydrogenase PdxA [Legionella sp.]|nr:MAG: 4-hydroxythreonine-4-phosphate dehydrogenase PdxA [Legionella sp.]PJE00143.1 MAG: 4-hydroxythreonine-4-phosphate dehydrogenase PdxA [Legionella sp.]
MKPVLVTSGEPSGIGPDLCLSLAAHAFPVVVLGDIQVLRQRAAELQQEVTLVPYDFAKTVEFKKNQLYVLSVACHHPVITGQLQSEHGAYVVELLTQAASFCERQLFSAVVTAPVHKANINAAGIAFTGHTEFFAEYFKVKQVVMMLTCEQMKVALVTTHLPLKKVPEVLTVSLITQVIEQLHTSLQNDFNIQNPVIKVAGLNPHAGEGGYLGREEIEVINPALITLQNKGINASGPYSADTLFVQSEEPCDAYVTMYHDQGLPVLKYAGFHSAVNITLGLPIIRTSVDHGTALHLAGTNKVENGSMIAATKTAISMAKARYTNDKD